MKIKFLGTAAAEGWPAIFCECEPCKKAQALGGKNIRTRSSCLIDDEYLVDFPPDTYMHKLRHGLNLAKVEHVFVTHSHSDHFYPKDLGMRLDVFAHVQGDKTLTVYGNSTVKALYDQVMDGRDTEGVMSYRLVEAFKPFKAGQAMVIPIPADHGGDEDCFIYIIQLKEKTLLYGHDSGYFPEESWEELIRHRFDGVLLDCTFGPREWRSGHMGLPANVDIKDRLIEEGAADDKTKFVVTHFSHNMGLMHDEMAEVAGKHGFITAYDGFDLRI